MVNNYKFKEGARIHVTELEFIIYYISFVKNNLFFFLLKKLKPMKYRPEISAVFVLCERKA